MSKTKVSSFPDGIELSHRSVEDLFYNCWTGNSDDALIASLFKEPCQLILSLPRDCLSEQRVFLVQRSFYGTHRGT